MAQKVTIKDIARIAKVSPTAVSIALNDRPGLSKKTRYKIIKIAEKLEYTPSSIAQSLVGKRSNTIGLIIENITDPFYPELTLGVEEKAADLGYSVLIANTGGSQKKEKLAIDVLLGKGADGIVISTVSINDQNVKPLLEDRFPVVFVNRIILDQGLKNKIDYVIHDDFDCGFQAIKHLYQLGHDRIAILTGSMQLSTALMRTNGALKALKDLRLVKDTKIIVECNYDRENAFKATKKLLAMENPPTAFFAQDDNMAIGVREAVLSLNLVIPDNVALIGVNNIAISSLTGISLTTINQNIYQIGSTGAEILINKIEKSAKGITSQIFMESKLLIRDSCGYRQKGYVR
jgi:LacI family transcriptional regulator